MANLPTDLAGIAKCLSGRKTGKFNLPPVPQKRFHFSQHEFPSQVPEEEQDEDDKMDEDDNEEFEPKAMVSIEENCDVDIGAVPSALPAEPGTLKTSLLDTPHIAQMTEREQAHPVADNVPVIGPKNDGLTDIVQLHELSLEDKNIVIQSKTSSLSNGEDNVLVKTTKSSSNATSSIPKEGKLRFAVTHRSSIRMVPDDGADCWTPTPEWIISWRSKLPLQTIMRLLQVLVPQVEKICIDKGLTDESEILKFLQHGTLVGLLPVPHPILIRKYQANAGTTAWFRTYIWGVIYLRNVEPAIWYDTDVKLFEIQRV